MEEEQIPQEQPEEEVQVDETPDVVDEAPEEIEEVTTEAPEVEEDDEPTFSEPAPYQSSLPPLTDQLAQLPVDEDGNADAAAFAQLLAKREEVLVSEAVAQALNAVENKSAARTYEEKLWGKAEAVLPEMKEDKRLRDMVQGVRTHAIMQGGNMSPAVAAKQVRELLGMAKENGAKQANESVRVQQSAHLESSSTYADTRTTSKQDLLQKSGSTDRREAQAAQEALLRDMIRSGDLKI